MHDDDAALDARLQHRMLFFTDAVFAIVLTLLVLELKPPESWHEATPATLLHAVPHIGAFIFSFVIIGVFWFAHMNTTRKLLRFDWPTAIANTVFLLPICLLPYATAWLGADLGGTTSWYLYAATMVAISAGNVAMVVTVHRGGGHLLAGGAPPRERLYRLCRGAAPGVAFALGAVLLALGADTPAHFCWLLIPLFFWLAGVFVRPKPEPAVEAEVAT